MSIDFAAMLAEARAQALGLPTNSNINTPKKIEPKFASDQTPEEIEDEIRAYCSLPFDGLTPLAAPLSIDQYHVGGLPQCTHYVPDFISAVDERRILDLAERAPRAKWTKLSARRLQNWGGVPRPEGLVPEALPQWQVSLIDRLMQCQVFDADKRPNHVLLNQYRAGEGILAHKDGPIYHPLVAIISLGSPITLSFYTSLAESKRSDGDCVSMLLQPRSLFLFSQQCYTDLFHGIVERTDDVINERHINRDLAQVSIGDRLQRSTRVSLTIRHVPVAQA